MLLREAAYRVPDPCESHEDALRASHADIAEMTAAAVRDELIRVQFRLALEPRRSQIRGWLSARWRALAAAQNSRPNGDGPDADDSDE
jgi:hypothetical protein